MNASSTSGNADMTRTKNPPPAGRDLVGTAARLDWPYLRAAVTTFAVAVALGAALLALSAVFERRMEQNYRQHRGRLDDITRRYLAVAEEEKIIEAYFPRFMALQQAGRLGEERRLDWIEALQDAGDTLRLPFLGYEIGARQPYHAVLDAAPGSHRVFVSDMTLNMQLLHEGDLFALLELLDERAQGLYTVSGCELSSNFVELTDNPVAGNVTADCLLQWFSLESPTNAEATP